MPHPRPAPAPCSPAADAAALVAGPRGAVWLSADGEVERLGLDEAAARVAEAPPLVCHALATARKLRLPRLRAFDLLELFAFVRPAVFCLPTARGLARALALESPQGLEAEALALLRARAALLDQLAAGDGGAGAAATAAAMGRAGWPWAPAVLAALGAPDGGSTRGTGLDVWNRLGEWSEYAPEPAPGHEPVSEQEARARLRELLGAGAEPRPEQADYAAGAAAAFQPRDRAGSPQLALAEAGTGIGKTLGYIAPASLWAQRNGGAVWLSTYTKNLQRQIDQELDRLYPDLAVKRDKAVVRKGRENYLCLLNLDEAAGRGAGTEAVALGLIARWALATRDGDMVGGDFPSWLADLLGYGRTLGLTDRRGECIYSACPHYRKCYIEGAIRKARRAEVVIANHALVMVQAAVGGEDRQLPTRYVFDEGHHVFDAADSAFSAHLTGGEMAELRRWVLGNESGRRGRARGLRRRLDDLVAGDDEAEATVERALAAARALPGEGWLRRLAEGAGRGAAEGFLARLRQQVHARNSDHRSPYSLEASSAEPVAGLVESAAALEGRLAALAAPLTALAAKLAAKLDDDAARLDSATRLRIEALCRGLLRRGEVTLGAWRAMLREVAGPTSEAFVDWFSIERIDGREVDVGMHRHWLDPTIPFTEAVLERAHGVLITSATLRDRTDEAPDDWATAEIRTGAHHVALPPKRLSLPSPFDYAAHTRVLVVTDVRRTEMDQVAAAYRELFVAAGGGGLGLFTAIARLRQVYARIVADLDAAGLQLLAQHVDPIDTPTLVDIFRAERDSCLLGTDAVRDGVDVPGRSLRLIVFDRVPWPRPDILHRARKAAFGGTAYDDMLARLRLKQAFGRLVRRADDAGVFVLLDAMMPSRLCGAFPEGVAVRRLGLAEAVAETASFLGARGSGD